MKPSKYQLAIYDAFENTDKNICVIASAGSGKTSTLIELLKKVPKNKSTIFLSFNKAIAEENRKKVPQNIDVSTIHSVGMKTLYKHYSCKLKVNDMKNFILAKKNLDLKGIKKDKHNSYIMSVCNLLNKFKFNLLTNESELSNLVDIECIGIYGNEIKDTLILRDKVEEYNESYHDEFMIDFTDMIYLPVKYGMSVSQYDNVLVDECLPYHMPVLLGDGSSISIGKIVEEKLYPEVLTYNTETGKQEIKRVIGHSKSVNSKKMYKICFRNKSEDNIGSFIACTFNHKVFIKGIGYVMAEDLKEGMVAQLETSAYKTQKYKITNKGRAVVSKTMIIKNQTELGCKNYKNLGLNLKSGINKGGNGWLVKRIKNSDLVKKYDDILDNISNDNFNFCYDGINCMVDVIVTEIHELTTKDKWVYDIEVEDNHNFYTNGILVHNCQDINMLQKRFIDKLIKPRGRFIAVGDEKQSIYGFMNADKRSFAEFMNHKNTITLPLSVSYRCSKAVVDEANSVIEGTEYYEGNPDGAVVVDGSLEDVQEKDLVLCRNNAPLVELYLYFLKNKKKSIIYGKDFGKALQTMLDKVVTLQPDEAISSLEYNLTLISKDLNNKGVARPEFHPKYISYSEKIVIIKILLQRYKTVKELFDHIDDIYSDDTREGIILSTIHAQKGRQATNVFLYKKSLIPSKFCITPEDFRQEKNLMYVAITRAINKFTYIKE